MALLLQMNEQNQYHVVFREGDTNRVTVPWPIFGQ